mmetsp:Transcript_110180/g.296579  ORF Transcript_110180/g.296579 Transcript_110180/m.296579 type:complete len:239 (-) Transcript_110180:424-1140(-)
MHSGYDRLAEPMRYERRPQASAHATMSPTLALPCSSIFSTIFLKPTAVFCGSCLTPTAIFLVTCWMLPAIRAMSSSLVGIVSSFIVEGSSRKSYTGSWPVSSRKTEPRTIVANSSGLSGSAVFRRSSNSLSRLSFLAQPTIASITGRMSASSCPQMTSKSSGDSSTALVQDFHFVPRTASVITCRFIAAMRTHCSGSACSSVTLWSCVRPWADRKTTKKESKKVALRTEASRIAMAFW